MHKTKPNHRSAIWRIIFKRRQLSPSMLLHRDLGLQASGFSGFSGFSGAGGLGLQGLGVGTRDSGLGTLTPSHGQHGCTYVCMYSVHEPKMKGPSESCRRPCRARDGQGMEGAVSFSFLLLAGSRGNVDRITRAGFWRSRAASWSLHRTTWWLGNGTNSRPWPSINALWALQ